VTVGLSYTWCEGGPYVNVQNGIYVVNQNRTRYKQGIFNWQNPPQKTLWNGTSKIVNLAGQWLSAPLTTDYTVIETVQTSPVLADIDGDNVLEILFSGHDGQLHCFWADGTEKFSWPVQVGFPSAMRVFNAPIVVDLNNDGRAEIIASIWAATAGIPPGCTINTCDWGSIVIYDYMGNLLSTASLPPPKSCQFAASTCNTFSNGIFGSLTAYDLDGNGLLDIVGVTTGSGLVRYEIQNSIGYRILWGTGKGTMSRYAEAPSTVRTGVAMFATANGNNDFGGANRPVPPTTTRATTTSSASVVVLSFFVLLLLGFIQVSLN